MEVDPVASMRCWAITLHVGGREYDIPALPAVDWWPVLAGVNPTQILELIPSRLGDSDDLDELLLSGRLDGDELGSALTDAIEEVTGRSFHVAVVLATVADQHWPVVGAALARTGFRWDVQPIGAALDLVYATIMEGLKDEDQEKFTQLLENEALTRPGKKRAPSERVIKEFEAMAGPRPEPRPLPKRSTGGPSGSARSKTQPRPRPRRQGGPSAVPRRPRSQPA